MFRKITEDEVIFALSEYCNSLGKKLYVVGGVVRDCIMGKEKISFPFDFDLTSSLTLDEIERFAKMQGLKLEVKNKKLEVVALRKNDEIIYEHARMRVEEYGDKSTHNPSKICFTNLIEEDAKRRDFTVNSVYYDRHNNVIVDPFNGVKDIKAKKLKTVCSPTITLAVDPARILRLVEVVARFDLEVNKDVLKVAQVQAKHVKNLSKDRLKKELLRINEDRKYKDETGYENRKNLIIEKLGLQWLTGSIK